MYFTPRTKLLPTLKFICIKEAPLRIRSIRSNRAIIEVLFPDRCRSIPKRTGQILTLPDRTIQLINAGALGFQLVWKYVKTDYRNDPVKYSLKFLVPSHGHSVRCRLEPIGNYKRAHTTDENRTECVLITHFWFNHPHFRSALDERECVSVLYVEYWVQILQLFTFFFL